MSLERSAQKNHLKSEYERYRKQAETARKEGHRRKAARYYRECVASLTDLADLENSDKLSKKRLELADNLKTAAEKLESGQPLSGDDSGSSGPPDGSIDSGTGTADSSVGGDDESDPVDVVSYLEDAPEMDFGDVGRMTNLKETLKNQVIDPLERPELYEQYDLGVVNEVLLYDPPGTGKTYITKALVGGLDYNFVEAQTSDVTSSLVGEAADNMVELFDVARNNQPCLLFLDEIDAIAAERDSGGSKTMSECQMITQFLTEMSELRVKTWSLSARQIFQKKSTGRRLKN